ncbi:MAG: hypothetical protein ACJLS3_05235 [Erythrobacter sp.]
MDKDTKTPAASMIAERDLMIGSLIVAIGVATFYIGYLGGRNIGSLLLS